MKYQEQLCIIVMPDNGPRRSFRLRKSRLGALLLLLVLLPFLSGGLGWLSWRLWQENSLLRANMLRFESDYQQAQATAERLENLDELLRESDVRGRDLVLRTVAEAEKAIEAENPSEPVGANAGDENTGAAPGESVATGDGPGHEEFPVVDTGFVKVGNVQARALRDRKLRIALDLRNTDNQKMASGSVTAILATAAGRRQPLRFEPEDAGDFRISRFKRSVMVARLPDGLSPVNARVILEVRTQADVLAYSNIFSVER